MVDKVSVNIRVISLNVEHNFLIPYEMNVREATALVLQTLSEEYSQIKRGASDASYLMQISTGKILDPSCSFKQLDIIQGEKLLLI